MALCLAIVRIGPRRRKQAESDNCRELQHDTNSQVRESRKLLMLNLFSVVSATSSFQTAPRWVLEYLSEIKLAGQCVSVSRHVAVGDGLTVQMPETPAV